MRLKPMEISQGLSRAGCAVSIWQQKRMPMSEFHWQLATRNSVVYTQGKSFVRDTNVLSGFEEDAENSGWI